MKTVHAWGLEGLNQKITLMFQVKFSRQENFCLWESWAVSSLEIRKRKIIKQKWFKLAHTLTLGTAKRWMYHLFPFDGGGYAFLAVWSLHFPTGGPTSTTGHVAVWIDRPWEGTNHPGFLSLHLSWWYTEACDSEAEGTVPTGWNHWGFIHNHQQGVDELG